MHPVAAISGLLVAVREFLVPILLFYFFGRAEEGTNWFLIIAIIIPVLSSIGRWYRFTYLIGSNHLSIKEGLLTQKQVEIPKNRVQSIDISAGLLQRAFGLVTVNIQIAGASESAVTLNAVTKTEADRVILALKEYASSEVNITTMEHTPIVLYKLSNKQLLFAGLSSGRLGVILTVLLTAIGQLETFYDIENSINALLSLEALAVLSKYSFVLIGLLVLILAWLLSILGTFLTYYAFELSLEDKNIVLSYGLLKRNHISIPLNRIQAVRFSEGLLRQYWGYGILYVESAGRGDQKEVGSHVILPFIHKNSVNSIIESILPELSLYTLSPAIKPPKIALRRYIQRAFSPLLLGVPLLLLLLPEYTWMIPIPMIGLGLVGYAQFKHSGFQIKDNTLVLFSRFISKHSVSLKRSRIQSFEIKTTPLLEKSNLWSFKLHLASVQKNMTFGLSYIDTCDKTILIDWLLKKS
jgi:putative membrane protein